MIIGKLNTASKQPIHIRLFRHTMSQPKVYSIPVASNFAESVCKHNKWDLQPMAVMRFPCGEARVDIPDSVRGQHVVLVGCGVGTLDGAYTRMGGEGSVNDYLMQVLIAVDAFKRASAATITLVLPNVPYSRQDRKDASRQPISARLVANMLETAGCDRLMTMDLHASQIQGMYNIPVDNLYGSPSLLEAVLDSHALKHSDPIAVVSPDAGGHKRVEDVVDRLRKIGFINVEMVYMHKVRNKKTGAVVRQTTIGEPSNFCILVDDMADTCGTLMSAAQVLKDKGVDTVVAMVTHGIFSNDALTKLGRLDCPIDVTYVTDTCFCDMDCPFSKVKIVSVAPVFAQAIYAVHNNESVSHLFR